MYRERYYYPATSSGSISITVIIMSIVGFVGYLMTPFSEIQLVDQPTAIIHYDITVADAVTGELLPHTLIQLQTKSQEEMNSNETDSNGVAIVSLSREQFADQVLELLVQRAGYEPHRKQLLVTQSAEISIMLVPQRNGTAITPFPTIPADVVFQESFDSLNERWPIGRASADSNVVYYLTNGQYHQMATLSDKAFIDLEVPSAAVQNFRWQTATAMVSTTPNKTVYTSFKFRIDESGNYYMLRLDNNGRYGVYRYYNKAWTTLHNMTVSNVIKKGAGETNLVDIRAVGNLFTITINGQELTTAIDGQARLAQAGQFMIATDGTAGVAATIMFDNIIISKID